MHQFCAASLYSKHVMSWILLQLHAAYWWFSYAIPTFSPGIGGLVSGTGQGRIHFDPFVSARKHYTYPETSAEHSLLQSFSDRRSNSDQIQKLILALTPKERILGSNHALIALSEKWQVQEDFSLFASVSGLKLARRAHKASHHIDRYLPVQVAPSF